MFPDSFATLAQEIEVSGHASVIAEDVDSAKPFNGLICKRLYGSGVGNVGPNTAPTGICGTMIPQRVNPDGIH